MAEIFEEMGLERAGAPGTTAALALLNDQVKKGGVMASSYVGGLSGAFIPVSEDAGMIEAARCGALTLEKPLHVAASLAARFVEQVIAVTPVSTPFGANFEPLLPWLWEQL